MSCMIKILNKSTSNNQGAINAEKVRKAIIPAAGLGTRFLPATKAMPKEMLPIVDKTTMFFYELKCLYTPTISIEPRFPSVFQIKQHQTINCLVLFLLC